MKAQLSVKREMSNAKAPVMGHVGAAVAGLGRLNIASLTEDIGTDKGTVSIRAYGAQEAFRQEAYRRIDNYTSANRTFRTLSRWIAMRGELLAGTFSTALAAYLVYGSNRDASETGFSLTMAGMFGIHR